MKFFYYNFPSLVKFSIGFFTALAILWIVSMVTYQGNRLSFPNALAAEDQNPTSEKFVKYNGSKYGFAIEYPQNWKKTEDELGVWFESPTDGTGNIRIESQPALKNNTFPEMVQLKLFQSEDSFKNFEKVSSNLTTLDGNPANSTEYQFKAEVPKFMGVDLFDYRGIEISALKGDRFYTVTYFSTPENFDIFLPILQKMLGTFKILE